MHRLRPCNAEGLPCSGNGSPDGLAPIADLLLADSLLSRRDRQHERRQVASRADVASSAGRKDGEASFNARRGSGDVLNEGGSRGIGET